MSPRECVKMAFLDVQGFKTNGEFIFKELALVSKDERVIQHYLFEPPFPYSALNDKDRTSNAWLTHNGHNLAWYCGVTKYSKLPGIIENIGRTYKCIFLKGAEKKQWLERYLPSSCMIVNVEEFGCPNLLELTKYEAPSCILMHRSCALTQAMRIKMWWENQDINTEYE